jgi:dGTPase
MQRCPTRERLHRAERYEAFRTERDKIGYLRALAIGVLIEDCTSFFRSCGVDLLAGRDVKSFADKILHKDALTKLLGIARSKCYNAADVLEIELSGYEALGGLLARFVGSARDAKPQRGTLEARALQFLSERSLIDREQDAYLRTLRITDYISGMSVE